MTLYVIWTGLIVSWNIRCFSDLVSTRLLCVNTFCSRTEWRHKCLHCCLQLPCVGPPFENNLKYLVVGTPLERDINFPVVWTSYECDTNSPCWASHSSVTSSLRCGEPFECHINPRGRDTIWVSHQLHVVGTPFECRISSTWWGHHLSVTSAPRGVGHHSSVTVLHHDLCHNSETFFLIRCILITWTCKRVQIHSGDTVNDSYWGETLSMW